MKVVINKTINGVNVKDMSKSEMIGVIRASEADIFTLKGVNTPSKAVDKEIVAIESFIKDVVAILDAKD